MNGWNHEPNYEVEFNKWLVITNMHANAINESHQLSFAHDQTYMPGLDLTGSEFLLLLYFII